MAKSNIWKTLIIFVQPNKEDVAASTFHRGLYDGQIKINPIAIFREELLHTLANASDVLSKEPLISQLFEVIPPSNSYSDWYEFNPLGWCISALLHGS